MENGEYIAIKSISYARRDAYPETGKKVEATATYEVRAFGAALFEVAVVVDVTGREDEVTKLANAAVHSLMSRLAQGTAVWAPPAS